MVDSGVGGFSFLFGMNWMRSGEYWTGIGYYSLGNGVGVYICARWHER